LEDGILTTNLTVDILALLGINGYLTYQYFTIDSMAGWLMVPYVGWLSFATYLCAGAGYLNNWNLKAMDAPTAPSAKKD
jgi:translocator protein